MFKKRKNVRKIIIILIALITVLGCYIKFNKVTKDKTTIKLFFIILPYHIIKNKIIILPFFENLYLIYIFLS